MKYIVNGVMITQKNNAQRVDVHDALEEALANTLAHTNYYGRRGILVVEKGKKLTISNPGTIRVTKEEFYAGVNSDPKPEYSQDVWVRQYR